MSKNKRRKKKNKKKKEKKKKKGETRKRFIVYLVSYAKGQSYSALGKRSFVEQKCYTVKRVTQKHLETHSRYNNSEK